MRGDEPPAIIGNNPFLLFGKEIWIERRSRNRGQARLTDYSASEPNADRETTHDQAEANAIASLAKLSFLRPDLVSESP